MSSAFAIAATLSRLTPAVALILALVNPNAASAQSSNSLFSITPTTGMIYPSQGSRSGGFGPGSVQTPPSQSPLPVPNAAAPNSVAPMAPMPMVPAGQVALALSAHFGKDAPTAIGGG